MPSRRLALIGSIWLLSAAGAFSLGWLSSGRSGGQRAKDAAQHEEAGQSANGATTASDAAAKKNGDASMAAFFGTHGSGLEQILAGRTLEQHVKKLLSQDDAALRMQGFLQLLDGLKTPDDLKAVLDLVAKENRRGGMRLTEQSLLLQKWAKMDATAAAGYASGLRDFSRMAGLDAVFKTWLQSDAEAAIAWAQKNGISSNDAGVGPGGPGGRDGGQDNWAMASLLNTLAKTNIDRAMEVAATQAFGRARGQMAETLIAELISQRGDQAAREAVLNISDEQLRAGFARELAQRLASTDPKGAAAWANGLPAGETRERAMAEAIQAWAGKDPVAAGQYLQQLGASPEFDRARQDYAQRVVRDDPEGALAWTQAITDERRRNETTQQVLRSWMRTDAPNAQAWAQANGVQIAAGPQGGPPGFGGGGRPRGGR